MYNENNDTIYALYLMGLSKVDNRELVDVITEEIDVERVDDIWEPTNGRNIPPGTQISLQVGIDWTTGNHGYDTITHNSEFLIDSDGQICFPELADLNEQLNNDLEANLQHYFGGKVFLEVNEQLKRKRGTKLLFTPLDYRPDATREHAQVSSPYEIIIPNTNARTDQENELFTLFNSLNYGQRDVIKYVCEKELPINRYNFSSVGRDKQPFYENTPNAFKMLVKCCSGHIKPVA